MPHPKLRTQPRRVDLLNNTTDYQCILLGAQGFSTKFLMARTGLTACQVTYRLHAANVRRSDYRNGTSPVASAVLRSAKTSVNDLMAKHLARQAAQFRAATKNAK